MKKWLGSRIRWTSPSGLTAPWRPMAYRSTDEYHNPVIALQIPPFGAVNIWLQDWSDDTEGHYSLEDSPACPVCHALERECWDGVDVPKGWWLNPPRPFPLMKKE